jgi:hypothetical protein
MSIVFSVSLIPPRGKAAAGISIELVMLPLEMAWTQFLLINGVSTDSIMRLFNGRPASLVQYGFVQLSWCRRNHPGDHDHVSG